MLGSDGKFWRFLLKKFKKIAVKTSIKNLYCLIQWISTTQPAITCSELTRETLEQGVKYV